MVRVNLILFAVLIACALALVTSQHRSRKLYVELQKEQDIARQLTVLLDLRKFLLQCNGLGSSRSIN